MHGLLKIAIDDHVVVLVEMVHLEAGVLQALGDGALAVLRPALQPRVQLTDRGRQDEHRHHVRPTVLVELQRTLVVDVEQDVATGRELLLHLGARRTVEVAVHLGALQQVAVRFHLPEGGNVDEPVVLAVDLVGAALARRDGDRQLDLGILLEERA